MASTIPLRWLGLAAAVVIGFSSPAVAASFHVHIQGFAFSPNPITVNRGDSITWHNHDFALHTATDNNCPRANGPGPCEFDSFNLANGNTFSHAFAFAGPFDYKCTIHGFTGRVNVVDPNAQPDFVVDSIVAESGSGAGMVTQKMLKITIRNAGDLGVLSSTVKAEYFYQGAWNNIGTAAVANAPAQATRLVTIPWTVTGKVGDFQVRATADSANAHAESDETNNSLTVIVALLVPQGTVPGTDLFDPL